MRPLALLTVLLLVAGCSGSSGRPAEPRQPPVTAFADGTCRTVAPDVLAIGRQLSRLGDGGEVPAPALEALTTAQAALRPLVEASEPAYRDALDRLVVAVGLVRLQARVGSYRTDTGDTLRAAYTEVVRRCTSSPPPSSPPSPTPSG